MVIKADEESTRVGVGIESDAEDESTGKVDIDSVFISVGNDVDTSILGIEGDVLSKEEEEGLIISNGISVSDLDICGIFSDSIFKGSF